MCMGSPMQVMPTLRVQERAQEFGDDDAEAAPAAAGDPEDELSREESKAGKYAWSGTDRDYTYDELLGAPARAGAHGTWLGWVARAHRSAPL